MKYAYRLLKDTTNRRDRTNYTLVDEIFPVPDNTKNGVNKAKGDHCVELTIVFSTKKEAEASLEYERYAERLKNISVADRRGLLLFDFRRLDKYLTFGRVEEVTGVKCPEQRYTRERFQPSPRYIARYHAVADIVERHMEEIRREVANLVPVDRIFKKE